MQAFFDESGLNPHTNKALVMGGFLASVEEWEQTSEAWKACLGRSPQIAYFKREEATNLNGEFLRFSRRNADEKMKDLALVLAESPLQGFCISVRHDLLAHRDSSASKKSVGSRTYDWAFMTATSGILQWAKDRHPNATVDFIFDERRELEQCIARFIELKRLAGEMGQEVLDVFSRAGTCTPANDKSVVALQMGDLLAGEFAAMQNAGEAPSATWKQIASRRQIVHMPCKIPRVAPVLVALEGMDKHIKDASGRILKRIYKNKESSPELAAECDGLIAKYVLQETAINMLMEIHQSDEGFRRFQEMMGATDDPA